MAVFERARQAVEALPGVAECGALVCHAGERHTIGATGSRCPAAVALDRRRAQRASQSGLVRILRDLRPAPDRGPRRSPTATATARRSVAIVNEAFARRFLNGATRSAIRFVDSRCAPTRRRLEIVGVVADAVYRSAPRPDPTDRVFVRTATGAAPCRQRSTTSMCARRPVPGAAHSEHRGCDRPA